MLHILLHDNKHPNMLLFKSNILTTIDDVDGKTEPANRENKLMQQNERKN